MQYLLTEEELNMGHQLVESWHERNFTLEEVYERSEALNKQGYFTVITNEEDNVELYRLTIYSKT